MHQNSQCGAPAQSYIFKIYQSNINQPGAAVLDCTPVYNQPCIITFIQADTTPCNTGTNTFNINGLVGFIFPPSTGNLIVKDLNSGQMDVISPPFAGQSSFSIKNIPCDGQVHTLQAYFTDGTCSLDTTIQAPLGECPTGVISGGGVVCGPGGNPVNVNVQVYGGAPPYSFTWALNGVAQGTVSNYSGPWPYVITTSTAGTYSLTSVSGSNCGGSVSGNAVVTVVSLPVVNLSDTTVCEGTEVVLDAGSGYSSYLWSTGAQSQKLTVIEPGSYSVTVTDVNGCQGSGTATVTHLPRPQPVLIKHQ